MDDPILIGAVTKAFPGINPDQAADIVSIGEICRYPIDVTLCLEGAFEHIFYIILDGQVKINKVINEGEDRFLKHLGPGQFFGEYALIHKEPRSATVITTKPTKVLEIRRPAFEALLRRNSTVLHAMLLEVSKRLRENDELAIQDLQQRADELSIAYQRLSAMEHARHEFIGAIAHELRTPLTAASGFLQMIQSGALKGEALSESISIVAKNVQRIVTLSNDILFLQEMDLVVGEEKQVDISQVLMSVLEKQQPLAEQNQVGFSLNISPRLPSIRAHRNSLRRAFSAILENAIKFSPDGGDVVIHITHGDGQILVTITDQGVGIPAEALPNIFDRFFRLGQVGDDLFDGVGLGLSIAQKVIDQHGGRIEVQSVLEQGSTFTVCLPLQGRAINDEIDADDRIDLPGPKSGLQAES